MVLVSLPTHTLSETTVTGIMDIGIKGVGTTGTKAIEIMVTGGTTKKHKHSQI